MQACGYLDALVLLPEAREIDLEHVAIWGDSNSAGVASVVAAIDDRVRAAVLQVPLFGERIPPDEPAGEKFEALKSTVLAT